LEVALELGKRVYMSGTLPNLRKCIGVPFANGGRDFDGADCWGMVMLTFGEFGIKLPDYKISCFDTDEINNQVDLERVEWLPLTKPEVPCLIVMRIDKDVPEACNHLGVFIGNGRFIHTLKKQNSIQERINHPYFSKKIEGFYRFVGKNDNF